MRKSLLIASATAGVSLLAIGGMGVASAAVNTNVGTSGIPKSVFKTERQDAATTVLNTSVTTIQAAHKDKTFSQLLTKDGLTKTTYHQKLKAQLTTDLQAKGYSQDQITIALQHRALAREHHKEASTTKS